MQKDVHFNLTYAISRKIGIPANVAEKIAWANQYTDDLTKADLHGIQTQSAILGNCGDRQIQLSVLVPFHFIPGEDTTHPWMTTRNNPRSQHLVDIALSKSDVFQFGIALHGLQDTFSHESFSGWEEKLNACYSWHYIDVLTPNVGHADLRAMPDIVNCVWTDPRNNSRIDNKKRTMAAAKATYDFLVKFHKPKTPSATWTKIRKDLGPIFKIDNYDNRKKKLCVLSGNQKIYYNGVRKKLELAHKSDFLKAAANHLAAATNSFSHLLT